jgi:hypothetical protein
MMRRKVNRLYGVFGDAGKVSLVWLRTKSWFKPALRICIVLVALCLVGLSYKALFSRNNVTHSKHGTSKKSHDSGKKTAPSSSSVVKTSQSAPQVYPSRVLNLTDWYLTLPIAKPGTNDPQTIKQPQLNSFALAPYFQLNAGANGVVFQAPAGGVTTKNSKYPRSELREMANGGTQEASWSDTNGTHTMTIRQAITHLPAAKPHVVAGQIHDDSSDVIEIRLEGSNLFVEADGKSVGTLDGGYQLGAVFTVQVTAANGHIQVAYNGVTKVDYAKSGSGYYFKAGCYTQSNPGKGDSPGAYGEVVIYGLQVSHDS